MHTVLEKTEIFKKMEGAQLHQPFFSNLSHRDPAELQCRKMWLAFFFHFLCSKCTIEDSNKHEASSFEFSIVFIFPKMASQQTIWAFSGVQVFHIFHWEVTFAMIRSPFQQPSHKWFDHESSWTFNNPPHFTWILKIHGITYNVHIWSKPAKILK